MKTVEVSMKDSTNIQISEEHFKEGIILKFVDEMPSNSERDDKHIRIYLAKKKTGTKLIQVPIEPTIPGHPNCHYGDCYGECHVVSCGIYQGYERVPELPADYEPSYQTIEVDTYD